MTETTKQVTKKTQAPPPAIPEDCFGATDDIEASDITIGRISIMQSNSTLLKEDKAKQGTIINLLDGKVLGNKEDKPLEFIPIKSTKYWIEKDADTRQFISRKPATHADEMPYVNDLPEKECAQKDRAHRNQEGDEQDVRSTGGRENSEVDEVRHSGRQNGDSENSTPYCRTRDRTGPRPVQDEE